MRWWHSSHLFRRRTCKGFTRRSLRDSCQRSPSIFQAIFGRYWRWWYMWIPRRDPTLRSWWIIPSSRSANRSISQSLTTRETTVTLLDRALCSRRSGCPITTCIFRAGYLRKIMIILLTKMLVIAMLVVVISRTSITTPWVRRNLLKSKKTSLELKIPLPWILIILIEIRLLRMPF